MNRLLDPKDIVEPLNRCYLKYHDWPLAGNSQKDMAAFRYHIEDQAGLRVTFAPEVDKMGRYGYGVKQVEVVDEHLYLVWTLKWT